MEIIKTTRAMTRLADQWRSQGLCIGFVPTMGYFHEGHIELMRMAKRDADKAAVSLYVNPTQFGPTEDLAKYPRDFDGDCAKAASAGVDVMFAPDSSEMYPAGACTFVAVDSELTKVLCGSSRPTHFRGVTTICAKLFTIVKPHFAVFGQKDYQQLLVIRRMVKDLCMDLEIIAHPTVREPDGLAMSSRNAYLSPEERKQAVCIYQAIQNAINLYKKGERSHKTIVEEVRFVIEKSPSARMDYIEIRRMPDLADPTQ